MPRHKAQHRECSRSRFYEMLRNGGELDGVRIMDPRTIRRATVEQSHMELDLSLGLPIGFSMGYMLGGRRISLFGGSFGSLIASGWKRDRTPCFQPSGKSGSRSP